MYQARFRRRQPDTPLWQLEEACLLERPGLQLLAPRKPFATPLRSRKATRLAEGPLSSAEVLQQALCLQDVDGLEQILSYGASRALIDRALLQAISFCHFQGDAGYRMAVLLLKHGADAGFVEGGSTGNTALHEAASNCSSAGVSLLLRHAADPNALNLAGRSPLHSACSPRDSARGSQAEVVNALLSRGADPTCVDSAGLRPSDLLESLSSNWPSWAAGRERLLEKLLLAERWRARRPAFLVRCKGQGHLLCELPDALFQEVVRFL